VAPRRVDRFLTAALVAFLASVLLGLRAQGLIVNDEGWVAYPALRMLEGDILYRDVSSYYAPLRYHAIEVVFGLIGPSLIAMRTLWMVLLLVSAAGCFRIARRFAPPAIALAPALLYGLAPGPWHKSPYGFCTVVFLLALVRALERPSTARAVLLGAAAGMSLVTRQDLGVLQLVLALVLVAGRPLLAFARPSGPALLDVGRTLARVFLGAALAVVPVLIFYAGHGALSDLFQAVVLQALEYSRPPFAGAIGLLRPEGFARTFEGPRVAGLLLASLGVLVLGAVTWLRRGRRLGPEPVTLLIAAVLSHALAAIGQGFSPPMLVRYLQAAIPASLLAAFVVGELSGGGRVLAAGLLATCVATQLWVVNAGAPVIYPSDAYTGSFRMARYGAPVEVLGDEVRTDPALADEIRLARSFVAKHVPKAEPIFTAPQHSLYYVLLDRPNATRFLADFKFRNVAMSFEQKGVEMERLRASSARYAFVSRDWWLKHVDATQPILQALVDDFGLARVYGSLAILERGRADRHELRGVAQRVFVRRTRPTDAAWLARELSERPNDPLLWELRGRLQRDRGQPAEAAGSFDRAFELEPEHEALQHQARAAAAASQGTLPPGS